MMYTAGSDSTRGMFDCRNRCKKRVMMVVVKRFDTDLGAGSG